MLELRQGLETLQSSEMMPKPTSTQISSPGDIGKGVFQNPHFQSNCLHIYTYIKALARAHSLIGKTREKLLF